MKDPSPRQAGGGDTCALAFPPTSGWSIAIQTREHPGATRREGRASRGSCSTSACCVAAHGSNSVTPEWGNAFTCAGCSSARRPPALGPVIVRSGLSEASTASRRTHQVTDTASFIARAEGRRARPTSHRFPRGIANVRDLLSPIPRRPLRADALADSTKRVWPVSRWRLDDRAARLGSASRRGARSWPPSSPIALSYTQCRLANRRCRLWKDAPSPFLCAKPRNGCACTHAGALSKADASSIACAPTRLDPTIVLVDEIEPPTTASPPS